MTAAVAPTRPSRRAVEVDLDLMTRSRSLPSTPSCGSATTFPPNERVPRALGVGRPRDFVRTWTEAEGHGRGSPEPRGTAGQALAQCESRRRLRDRDGS